MEAEPAEASWSSTMELGEKEGWASRSSSTAREVDEEVILPGSTSLESEEDMVLPRSTALEGEGNRRDLFLTPSELETLESPAPQGKSKPSSRPLGSSLQVPQGRSPREPSSPLLGSSSPVPQSLSPSEPSSLPPESSALSSPVPSTSSLSWKAPPDELLQQLLEEEEEGRREQGSAWTRLSQGRQDDQKTARKKAPAKKGLPNYTVRPVMQAEKAELVSVAKAMHRENFGRNFKELFHLEKEAALKSIQTGLYIGWRCPEYLWDCFRVGDESRCFCGHLLKLHQVYIEKRATVPCTVPDCKCQSFVFIPSCPEEVGEFWLQRRTGFNPATWRAKCRCKHTHEEHTPTGMRGCLARGCSCAAFTSRFLCAACDRRWEEHETFFESEETRRKGGRPYGKAYLPFAEMPELCNAVLTGRCEDPSASAAVQGQARPALPAPSGSHALPLPPSGPRRLVEKDDRKA